MRALRITAIVAVSLLLVMVLMVGYMFMTAEVVVTNISAQGIATANDTDAFSQLTSSVKEDTFTGTLYQKPQEWKEASDYVYITYTLNVTNNCLVPIDMIEVQIVPLSQDILQLSNTQTPALAQRTSGDVSATILTAQDSHPVREIILSYYVWGFGFTLHTTYGK